MISSRRSNAISMLLICLSVTIVLLAGVPTASANKYKKALKIGGEVALHSSGEVVDYDDPSQYTSEDSLITKTGKSNMISQTLRYVHKRSEENLLKRSKSKKEAEVEGEGEGEKVITRDSERSSDDVDESDGAVDQRTDDEVIQDACKDRPTKPCAMWVKLALKRSPEVKRKIALAFRNKAKNVDGPQLLYHKLFESAVNTIEKHNIDDKLDLALDIMVKRNPYALVGTYVAKKVLTPVLKAKNNAA